MDTSAAPAPSQTCSVMARVALGLSILAFLPPLGIAAVVLGHTAERRIDASSGTIDGKSLLVAVPRLPRMPADAKVFYTDQSGVLMQVHGGTSVDCLKHGEPAN